MRVQAALVHTDIVESTLISERLGDVQASSLWQAHDQVARRLLRDWRGREIDRADGFLLMFGEPSDAAAFAREYLSAIGSLEVPLQARVGLHFGQVVTRQIGDEDVSNGAKRLEIDGTAKPISARLMSIASPGQILLSREAKERIDSSSHLLRSHGYWKLKGVAEPIELFELGNETGIFTPPADVPKAYSVWNENGLWAPRRQIRHTLPSERDSFVGRRSTLRDLIRGYDEGARLTTILGMGGAGKTRVAQRFGREWLGDFPGGVWFCDLSQAASLDGLFRSVAEGLSIAVAGDNPALQITNALIERGRCLVILDNFEQVSQHAEATLGSWLDRTAEARFLVTTREVLGIVGENILSLPPMDLDEGAELFARRAKAASGDVRPEADDHSRFRSLASLLEGLPLAIELAAARVRTMSLEELSERVGERFELLASSRGRPGRQATLRATLDWSWDLLSAHEKAALAQLSVFQGSFDRNAAAAVLDDAHDSALSVIDIMQLLVDKSLVRRLDNHSFGLLASVREYAAEQLIKPGTFAGSGIPAATASEMRHAAYFARLSEEHLTRNSWGDLDDMAVACRRAARLGEGHLAVSNLKGAWGALRLRGPFGVGIELASLCLAIKELDAIDLVAVERIIGVAFQKSGNMQEAQRHFDAGLVVARRINDATSEAWLVALLGELDAHLGNTQAANDRYVHALAIARNAGATVVECLALNGLGSCSEEFGKIAAAEESYQNALATARTSHDRRAEGGCLGNLGRFYADQGDLEKARPFYLASLSIAREMGDRQWEGNALCNLGLLEQTEGRLEEAMGHLKASLALAEDLGHVRLKCIVLCNLGLAHDAAGSTKDAQKCYASAIDVARRVSDVRAEAQFLGYLGLSLGRDRDFVQARECFGASVSLSRQRCDSATLGLALCQHAEIELKFGDVVRAQALLKEATAIASSFNPPGNSEFGRGLARATTLLSTSW